MLFRLACGVLGAALAADLMGVWLDAPLPWMAGWVLMAVGACLAGLHVLVECMHLARGSGARRALPRLLSASLAVALTAPGWWVRGDAAIPPDPAVLLVEAVVLALLLLSGRAGRLRRPDPA